jgi:hypothetical protein
MDDKHKDLCHDKYGHDAIKSFVFDSDDFMFFHTKSSINDIVGFALLKYRKSTAAVEIVLVCAKVNTEQIGSMVAYSIFEYAVRKKCKSLITIPRTSELKSTFMRHGFKSVKSGNVEKLEKKINITTYDKTNHTRKTKRRSMASPRNIRVHENMFENTNATTFNTSPTNTTRRLKGDKKTKYTLRNPRTLTPT